MNRKRQINAIKKSLKKKAQKLIETPLKGFQKFCYYVGLIVVVCTAGFLAYSIHFLSSLPDLKSMEYAELKTKTKTQIKKRYENPKMKHRWTDLKDISRDFLYTVVTSEDAEFFEHGGVDIDAILASAALNLKAGKYAYGASTISQQVVKNLFLGSDKTISRKLKEILITQELEKRYSKNDILELYLNLAEFGPDLFGVRAAAWHYFRKRPSKINAAEGAFMALMLPSPRKNHYAIFQNRNLTPSKKKKIRRVLRDLLSQEYISAKQYRRYLRFDYFARQNRALATKKKKKPQFSY